MRLCCRTIALVALVSALEFPAHRDRLMKIPEAATRLGITERFLRNLIYKRKIAVHRFNNCIRLGERDLDRYVESCRIEAEGPQDLAGDED